MTTDLTSHGTTPYRRHAKILAAVVLFLGLGLTGAVLGISHQRRAVDRARRNLAERIRAAYALPQSSSSSPLLSLGEVVKDGMLPVQVDSILGRIRSEVVRIEWFVVQSPNLGPVGVAQGVILGTSKEELVNVYVYYVDGRVAFIRDEHRGNLVPITADSARGFLGR